MRAVLGVLWILVAGAAIAETAGQVWVYATAGMLPALRDAPVASDEPKQYLADTRQKLSPIFGYGLRPGWSVVENTPDLARSLELIGERTPPPEWRLPANNYGFISPVDYPYSDPDETAFYVAVTGGSVANGLAVSVPELIAKAVNAASGYEARKVVVLNMSGGGYKQPQQSLILSYFLSIGQEIDLILNMDGLNEAYTSWENEALYAIEPALPGGKFLYGLLNHFASGEAAEQVARAREQQDDLRLLKTSTRSALVYMYAEARLARVVSAEIEVESEISGPVEGRAYPMMIQAGRQMDLEALSDEVVDIWARGSIAIWGMAEQFGAKYIHVLQPNQYHTRKVFLDAERAMAFQTPEWNGAPIVRLAYPKLVARGAELAARGIHFVDLTGVFDGNSEHLYFDACCHFRRRGYELLLSEALNGEIARALR
jgi:hypothetical protein